MNGDRISELPEPLKYHILSYLPTKCAVRTCILSNSWRTVWTGLTCFQFDGSSIVSSLSSANLIEFDSDRDDAIIAKRESVIRKLKEFYGFLSRAFGLITKLDQLDLCVPNCWLEWDTPLDHWLDCVVRLNVQKLKLKVTSGRGFRNVLPKSVLSCKSIVSLSLSSFDIRLRSLTDTPLLCLTKLSLINVSLHEGVLERLLADCVNLQSFDFLDCYGLDEIKVLGLSKLERVQVVDIGVLESIEIDAPNLLEFILEDKDCTTYWHRKIEVLCCTNMKRLALVRVAFAEDDLSALLETLPALEDLMITKCKFLEHVEIMSQQLVSLTIIDCKKLVKVNVGTPNLQDFKFSGKYPLDFVCKCSLKLRHANICLGLAASKERWFPELVKFLTKLGQSEKLSLAFILVEDILIPANVRLNSLPPLYGVKQLQVAVRMPPQNMAIELIESLLWLAPCPESISISYPKVPEDYYHNMSSRKLLKFKYQKPLKRKKSCGCWKPLPVHCWQHSLNEVLLETQEQNKSNTHDPSLPIGEVLLKDNNEDIDAMLAKFFQRSRLDGKTVSFVKVAKPPKVEWE